MQTQLQSLTCGPYTLIFCLDGETPYIECENNVFRSLPQLVDSFHNLTLESQQLQLCKCINHLSHGLIYRVIEDPENYRKGYYRRVEQEDSIEDPALHKLSDYGDFSVDQIQTPHLQGRQLVFYVEQVHTGLPYQVKVPFPIQELSFCTNYDVLPCQ